MPISATTLALAFAPNGAKAGVLKKGWTGLERLVFRMT
jgi:hypothetical protein